MRAPPQLLRFPPLTKTALWKPPTLASGDHPNSRRKTRSENAGANEIFLVGSHQFQESLRELLRELWFSYCSSREMPFREWNFAFRESVSEFRELLREYPRTLQSAENDLFTPRVFPEIGVVPRLLIFVPLKEVEIFGP